MSEIKTGLGKKMEWVDGQIIPAISGNITKLYPPKPGSREDGTEYSRQGGEIEINGVPIKFTMWDCQTLHSTEKGKNILISSAKSKRGLTGIKYEIDSYKTKEGVNVTEEALKISNAAAIQIGSGEDFEKEINSPASEAPSKPFSKPLQVEVRVGPIKTVEDLVEQVLKVHYLCHKEANSLYKNESPETRQAYTASIFIEANKHGAQNLPFKSES